MMFRKKQSPIEKLSCPFVYKKFHRITQILLLFAGHFSSLLEILLPLFLCLQTSQSSSNTENKQDNFQSKEDKEDRNIETAKRVREKVSKQKGPSERLSK